MNISIVVPVYNAQRTIAKTAEGCLNQDYSGGCIDVIFVDDGSTDGTAGIVKQFALKYIYQENSGPASARNRGFKESSGELVVFTDSDCVPAKSWISKVVEGFTGEDIGAVAGSYDIANPESLLSNCIHEEIKLRHLKLRDKKYIRAFGSYNVAIRRNVFEKAGGYNESYRAASGEDNDLSYKILKAGYKIKFQEDAVVAHTHTEKLWKYLREQYRHGYWRMKLYKDFPDMAKGDDYTTFKDIFEPLLPLMGFCSVVFLWHKYGVILFMTLMATNGLMQLPSAIKAVKIKKNFKLLYMALVTFIRSYARAFGMIKGIWKFYLYKPLRH